MTRISFHIPGDPVAKGRPRFIRATGRTYTPEKTATAERSVAQFAQEAMRGHSLFDEPLALVLDYAFLWPKNTSRKRRIDMIGLWKTTKPDLDNLIKIKDALNGVVWIDDALVCLILARKVLADKPGTNVTICPINSFNLATYATKPYPVFGVAA